MIKKYIFLMGIGLLMITSMGYGFAASTPNPVPVIGGYFQPSGYYGGYSGYHYWINYCPLCHHYYTLEFNPKGTKEHELTCSCCDADFDGTTGADKDGDGARGWLLHATSSQRYNWIHRYEGNNVTVNNTTVQPIVQPKQPSLLDILKLKIDEPFLSI